MPECKYSQRSSAIKDLNVPLIPDSEVSAGSAGHQPGKIAGLP